MKRVKKAAKTVDCIPSWEACVRIYMACLENLKASASSKHGAREEIIRLAKYVNRIKRG